MGPITWVAMVYWLRSSSSVGAVNQQTAGGLFGQGLVWLHCARMLGEPVKSHRQLTYKESGCGVCFRVLGVGCAIRGL